MKILFLVLFISPFVSAQWMAGASYKIKSEVPSNGIGLNINRNLPLQGASFGVHLRFEINLFRETAAVKSSLINEQKFLSEDYNLQLIGNYYFRNFTPYFGLGGGYAELDTKNKDWQGFVFSLIAGNKFIFNKIIIPYLEVQLFKYFGEFNSNQWGRDIDDYQLRGTIGIYIPISSSN